MDTADHNFEQLAQIDAYLAGELREPALEVFKQAMADDPNLRKAVQEQEEMVHFLTHLEIERIQQQALKWLREEEQTQTYQQPLPSPLTIKGKQPTTARIVPFRQRLLQLSSLAAILTLAFGIYWAVNMNTLSSEMIIAAGLQKNTLVSMERNQRGSINIALHQQQIQKTFKGQKYDSTLYYLAQFPISDTSLVNKGICYLHLGQPIPAINALEKALQYSERENKHISDKIKINLARAYILNQEAAKAIPILTEIKAGTSFAPMYREEAEALLKVVDK